MILYTIFPMDIIFGNYDYSTRKTLEVDYLGERVEIMEMTGNQYIINRILSTSPEAYLNPHLQPGMAINGPISIFPQLPIEKKGKM